MIVTSKTSVPRRYTKQLLMLLVLIPCLAALALTPRSTAQAPSPRPFPDPAHAFELVAQEFTKEAPQTDANCLLLNPQWRWQVEAAAAQLTGLQRFPDSIDSKVCKQENFGDCSGPSQAPWLDRTPVLCPMCFISKSRENRIHGHVNWFPATYTGTICFHNFSFPDMDYTFSFQPDGEAGLTRWNAPSVPHPTESGRPDPKSAKCGKDGNELCEPKIIHVEFDSKETIEHFVSDGWTEVRNNASPCNFQEFRSCHPREARKDIESKRAVVVGLVGLDSEHSIYSELHPVYALAIQMNKPTSSGEAWMNDDKWLVFARDRGNEGACSVGEPHHIFGLSEPQTLRLLIPAPEGRVITGVSFTSQTKFFSNNASSVSATYYDQLFAGAPYTKNNRGVLLSFDLRDCQTEDGEPCSPLIEGEVHIKWEVAPLPAVLDALIAPLRKEDECTIPTAEDREEESASRELSREQKKDLFQLILGARGQGLRMMQARQRPEVRTSAAPLEPCSIVANQTPGNQGDSDFVMPPPAITKTPNGNAAIINILTRKH